MVWRRVRCRSGVFGERAGRSRTVSSRAARSGQPPTSHQRGGPVHLDADAGGLGARPRLVGLDPVAAVNSGAPRAPLRSSSAGLAEFGLQDLGAWASAAEAAGIAVSTAVTIHVPRMTRVYCLIGARSRRGRRRVAAPVAVR